MAGSSAPAAARLAQDLATATSLVSQFQETLAGTSTEITQPDKPINPLALASTAAALIKAHTTKLTLLALNRPFSPTSISQILNSISTSPLPALLTSVQIFDPMKFSRFGKHELQTMVNRLFTAYGGLLAEIPTTPEEQTRQLGAGGARTTTGGDQNAALMGTGLVWGVCDEIVAFAEQGLSEKAAKQMSNFRDLFKDAKGEIQSWLEDAKENAGLGNRLGDLQLGGSDSDLESIESFSQGPIKEMIPATKWTLEILDLVFLLFAPLIKRRIKRFPTINGKSVPEDPTEAIIRLDKLLEAGKYWSEQTDAVAESLFENDREVAISRVDQLVESVEAEAQDILLNWDGSEDELSAWIPQWSSKLTKVKSSGRPLS